ncbi:unnamed protein product, partial [marine sediment metagenome]
VSGNQILNANWHGIWVGPYTSDNIIIKDNIIRAGATHRHGIYIDSEPTNVFVLNNIILNVSGSGVEIYMEDANNVTCSGNVNFVTENSGTGTVANGDTDTGNIAHGLAYTPDTGDFTIVPTNSMGAATKFYVGGIDGTNFVIYVDADPTATTATFAWSVRRR